MMPMLEKISRMGTGTGFTILMEYEGHHGIDKDYAIYPRFDQPCQGGDMRRYSSVHGDLATQPHNPRPGDLSQPFPAGKPSAIAFHTLLGKGDQFRDIVFDAVTSDTSPWRKGFGSNANVLPYRDKKGHVEGFILKSLDVDPTVMVNMVYILNTLRYSEVFARNFNDLMNEGLSQNEALAAMMLNGFQITRISATDTYRYPPVFSARRFFEQKPKDLSGGLYSEGADYNRTYIQDVFLGSKDEGGIVWLSAMTKKLGKSNGFTIQEFVKAAKEVFDEALQNEPELTADDTKYVYRDATGAVLPYPKRAIEINPSLKIEAKTPKKKVA